MGSLTKAQRAILAKDKDQLPVTALPGIGPRIGRYMKALGYARVGDLRGADPAEMYARHNVLQGFEDDLCFLYVFRMAVHFAENEVRDLERLRWWNWREEDPPREGGPTASRGSS